jgi:ubiquinone/menaquinone biosynthesis C-methylase UbiE/3-isopropylmalate dehydratase small subunit
MPAGAKVLPLRSNIPAISEYVFEKVDPSFATRAKQQGGGIVVGGSNYGQGSSREHAALAPMYLGVRAVITKSFARIHRDNLINFGILPLTFVNPEDYDRIDERDELVIEDARERLVAGAETLTVRDVTKDFSFEAKPGLSPRQVKIIKAGGLLNFIREQGDASKIEREATAAAWGTTTALPTKTTKTTDTPGAMPRPLSRAELFDQLVVERASRDASEHDKLGHGLHEKADRRLADILSPKEGDVCLDVATASGNLAIAMGQRVGPSGKVLAIDLAEGMLEFAQRKARAHKARNVEFVRMDAQNLEFEDNTFDVVACGLALFYFPDIEGALQEMWRVLKPGGKLGVSSADAENAFSPLSEPYMAGLRKTSERLNLDPPAYSELAALTRRKDGLQDLIKKAGFEHVEISEEDIPVRFNSFEDWWTYGRGSTWGEILLDQMTQEQRSEFQLAHNEEVGKLFGDEGVKTATPVLFAIAEKPKK